jgi:hypothetical protein
MLIQLAHTVEGGDDKEPETETDSNPHPEATPLA